MALSAKLSGAVGVTIVGTLGNSVISTTVMVPDQLLAVDRDGTIVGRPGADTLARGAGKNTYYVYEAADQVIVIDDTSDALVENADEGTGALSSLDGSHCRPPHRLSPTHSFIALMA